MRCAVILAAFLSVSSIAEFAYGQEPRQTIVMLNRTRTAGVSLSKVSFSSNAVLRGTSANPITTMTQSVFQDRRGFIIASVGDRTFALYDNSGVFEKTVRGAFLDNVRLQRVYRMPSNDFLVFDGQAMSRLRQDGTIEASRLAVGFAAGFFKSGDGFSIPFARGSSSPAILHVSEQGELADRLRLPEVMGRAGRLTLDSTGNSYLASIDNEHQGYKVVMVSPAGNLLKTMVTRTSWYQPESVRPASDQDIVVPVTSLQSLTYAGGYLWLLFHILKPGEKFGDEMKSLGDWERRYDFALEVVDPSDNSVVFSAMYKRPPFYSGVDGTNRFFTYKEDGNRRLSIEIITPSLNRN
jgi:hypothetical protein